MARQWRLLVGILISVFFLYWIVHQIGNLPAVWQAVLHANYWYIVPGLVAYFFGVWLRAWRWHFLLRPVKAIRPSALFPVVVIGYMANDILPVRLGEVVRAYVLTGQEGVATSTTLATIVVERIFDGLAMLIFVGAVALFYPLQGPVAQTIRIAALLFLVALIVFIAIASSKRYALALVRTVEQTLPSRFQGRVEGLAERFLQGLDVLQSAPLAAAVLLLSLAAWSSEALMYYLISLGFQLGLGYPAFVLTAATANLSAMVPAAPGYIGTFDFGALEGLALFGLSQDRAAAYVGVLHVVLLVPVTLLGFFYLWRMSLSLGEIRRLERRPRGGI